MSGLSMSEKEIANYDEIKKPIGQLIIRKDTLTYQKDIKEFDFDNFNENTEKVYYINNNDKNVIEVNSKNMNWV